MRLMLYIIIIIFTVTIFNGCGDQNKKNIDCDFSLSSLKRQVKKLIDKRQYKLAEKKAKSYKSCFENNVSYWSLRMSTLKSSNPHEQPSHQDALKAVKYINNAISAEPQTLYLKVVKSGALFAAKQSHDAEKVYEKQLSNALPGNRAKQGAGLYDVMLVKFSSLYANTLKHENNINRAKRHLKPYLSYVCTDLPKIKHHYVVNLIEVYQIFNNKRPSVPQSAGARTKALDQACSSFRNEFIEPAQK